MKQQTVLILFGGVSNEYEVSLRTACSILENIDRSRFVPVPVGITRDGRWLLTDASPADIAADRWQERSRSAILSPDRADCGLVVRTEQGVHTITVDAAFLAVHGQNCEDGALQGLLELADIPYVGSGVAASAAGFDKELTHIVAEHAGVPMARWLTVCAEQDPDEAVRLVGETLGYPVFVKPANSGSSVGTAPARDEAALRAALKNAFVHDRRVLVEELVVGQEVECAVLGNLEPFAPTTGEIVTSDGFYDYDSKYKNDSARLLIPADIPAKAQEEVRRLAVEVYRALGCRGLSRVDFFVCGKERVVFNEINTLPGFTSISMYPKMMVSAGIGYGELITRLIELALEERLRRPQQNKNQR